MRPRLDDGKRERVLELYRRWRPSERFVHVICLGFVLGGLAAVIAAFVWGS